MINILTLLEYVQQWESRTPVPYSSAVIHTYRLQRLSILLALELNISWQVLAKISSD